jgi:hypothetical protein
MAPTLTREQVLALAPDASSLAAARSLAASRAWLSTGRSDQALWGECKGSAREPYRTQVELGALAVRCSCPSRKFPCKHGLGLMLLLAAEPEAVAAAEPPPWVAEWLAGRARAAERRQAKEQPAEAAAASAAAAPAKAAPGRSAAAREERVAAGMAELELWVQDRVRAGLAALPAEAPGSFLALAGRMVDAQAPGAARLLRAAGYQVGAGAGWQSRLLDRLGRLYLLARAYRNLAALPAAAQADVRAALGFTQSQEELLAGPGLRDSWLVLGRRVEDEDRLQVQRTWLWGAASGRPTLVLDFSAAGQPLNRNLTPGLCLEAELVFYPGAAPLRALVRARHGQSEPPSLPPAALGAATGAYAAAIAANPWLERGLLLAGPCTLARGGGGWRLQDEAGRALPLPARFEGAWRLLAITGGRPFALAGEWDGETLTPLCAQQGGRLIMLGEA